MCAKVSKDVIRKTLPDDVGALKDIIVQQAEAIDDLRAMASKQQTLLGELQENLRQANQQINELNERLEQAERENKRQAAPFRVPEKKKKKERKKPGRKKGHPGSHRPKPDHVDEEVDEPLTRCPHCEHTIFENLKATEQFIEDLPPVRPHVTRLVTYRGRCAGCGAKVRSTHPMQVTLASAAAGVHLGPRALAVATDLNKRHGLTMRKTCAVLEQMFGLRITPGGLSQAIERVSKRLAPAYERLQDQLRQAPVAYADETSWWVGGPKWWLWVFTNPSSTVYRVAKSRARDVIYQTLGLKFDGVLVSDCLSIYDDVNERQHKCYSHHLQAISKAIEKHPNGGAGFLNQMRAFLRSAIRLKPILGGLPPPIRTQWRKKLEDRADELLGAPRSDPLEESVRVRIVKQRDHLFTFLDYPEVDATNNLAERQLRPAVISRKVSCGNKTPNGARAWEILASLSATCVQRGISFLDFTASAMPLRAPPAHLAAR